MLSTTCFSRLNLISNGFNFSLLFFFWAVELAKFAFLLDFTIFTNYFNFFEKITCVCFEKQNQQTEQISKGCVILLRSADKISTKLSVLKITDLLIQLWNRLYYWELRPGATDLRQNHKTSSAYENRVTFVCL